MVETRISSSTQSFNKKVDKITARLPRVRNAWARKGAETILKNTRPFVPIDTGQLRESGEVDRVGDGVFKLSFSRFSYSEKYGEFDVAYWTHEAKNPHRRGNRFSYTPSTPGTGRKYLDKGIKASRGEYKGIAKPFIDFILS